jgi:hypothetical protein
MGICGLVAMHPMAKMKIPKASDAHFRFLHMPIPSFLEIPKSPGFLYIIR